MKRINIEKGFKKNYLTVIKEATQIGRRRMVEVCCDCGVTKVILWENFCTGKTKTCGCLIGLKLIGRDHRFYKMWTGMKQRCYNKKSTAYRFYGGRGVKICDRWLVYDNFYNDNINKEIPKGYELDRYPDMNGDYSPENTRWVSKIVNLRNRIDIKLSADKVLEIRKSKKNSRELSLIYNVCMNTIRGVVSNRTWKI